MPRPLVGNAPLKALVGRTLGWQSAIGPRVNDWEGAPTTGDSPDDKYLLPISIQSLEGLAEGTSTASGALTSMVALEGTANGTSTATGNLVDLVLVPIEGTANGTSTVTADLTTVRSPSSPSDAASLPNQMRLVPAPTPTTAVGEGLFIVSNGAGGLNSGEPYWVPESSGTPISLYEKVYVEDLAETLIFGGFTDGTDIVVSNGDMIRSENSGAGVPGRPVVLSPGTTVDTDVGGLVWAHAVPAASTTTRGKGAVDLQASQANALATAGSNYTAIVGGQHNSIGLSDPALSSAHYSGVFGGLGAKIWRNATHSIIVGGGGDTLVRSNTIQPGVGESATHNVIIATYGATLKPGPGLPSNCNFVHGVWSPFIYRTSYSTMFGANQDEMGTTGALFANTDLFTMGVSHDIWQGTGATHGNEATALFGRQNDTYSAINGALFGRFTRLGTPGGSGVHGSCVGGNTNRLNSDYTFSWGSNNFTSGGYVGAYSLQFGSRAEMNSGRQFSFGGQGEVGWPRGSHLAEYVRRGETTDATPLDITPAGTAPNGLQINLRSSASTTGVTWNFEILVVARQTSAGPPGAAGDSAMWLISGCIKYLASTTTTTFVGAPTGTGTPSAFNDAGAAAWTVTLTADDTDDKLVITVTGEANKTISWLARVTDSEVRGGS